jgi:mRNA interferase RelE/StbE
VTSEQPPAWKVELSPAALRQVRRLDGQIRRRVLAAVTALATVQRPAGIRALTGHSGLLRIKVGDYRVVYTVQDDKLVVLVVTPGHRRDVYRNL